MEISVLQWNVLFQEKADNILKLIQEVDAGVVCLQELTQTSEANPGRDLPGEIAKLGYEPTYVVTIDKPLLQTSNQPFRMGNGIFSKLPVQSSREVFARHEVPGSTGPSNESRAYLEVRLTAEQKQLTVGTAHLSFAPGFSFSAEKQAEAERFKAAIKNNQSNFIFTGDFNALPDSHLIAELDRLFKPAGPPYTQATWTTKPFEKDGFKANTLNWRLDYVYTTPDVKVVSAKIIETDYSDHLPILVVVDV